MTDLNNHLFSQLEKLLDPDLSDDELKKKLPVQVQCLVLQLTLFKTQIQRLKRCQCLKIDKLNPIVLTF